MLIDGNRIHCLNMLIDGNSIHCLSMLIDDWLRFQIAIKVHSVGMLILVSHRILYVDCCLLPSIMVCWLLFAIDYCMLIVVCCHQLWYVDCCLPSIIVCWLLFAAINYGMLLVMITLVFYYIKQCWLLCLSSIPFV